MSCARCEHLCLQVPIRTPGELEKVALAAKANLEDGAIIEISGDDGSTSFSTFMRDRSLLPDIIRAEFRCVECAEGFLLECECYHGRGGNWSHTPPRQNP